MTASDGITQMAELCQVYCLDIALVLEARCEGVMKYSAKITQRSHPTILVCETPAWYPDVDEALITLYARLPAELERRYGTLNQSSEGT
jgi:hypothetical protein